MGETITITRKEYDTLRCAAEELGDLRAYDKAMAALASGEDELIPAAFAHRIIDGESPIRVYREFRSLTQEQLGKRADVNRVQIADIEAGRKSGSIDTLRKLANALGVTIDDLVG